MQQPLGAERIAAAALGAWSASAAVRVATCKYAAGEIVYELHWGVVQPRSCTTSGSRYGADPNLPSLHLPSLLRGVGSATETKDSSASGAITRVDICDGCASDGTWFVWDTRMATDTEPGLRAALREHRQRFPGSPVCLLQLVSDDTVEDVSAGLGQWD